MFMYYLLDMEDLPKKDTMRRSPLFSQPQGTLQYTVQGNDTLNSIALHVEWTPTQLMRLNHLSSRMLYPGQILYVPDPNSTEPICLSPTSTTKKTFDLPVVSQKTDIPKVTQSKTSNNAKRFLLLKSKSKEEKATSSKRGRKSLLRYQTEPRPGRVIRERSQDDDAEESKNFLKLNVKYITDGEGVVSGTMLVTPNAIMFDPNVSDPLVKERGTSPYGVITQMDAVRGAAMYHDISAMNLKTKPESAEPGTCPVYVPENAKDCNKESSTSQNATSPSTDVKPEIESNEKPSQKESVLRTISNLSDGFVHVIDDVEKGKQPTDATGEMNRCTSIPEGDGDVEMDNLVEDEVFKKEDPELQKQEEETVMSNGNVGCESIEGALHNDLDASTTPGDTVTPQENDSGERIILEDSHQSQDIKDLSERDLIGESTLRESTDIEGCNDMESQDQVVPSDSKGSLPDLVESAEQSVKDKDSPTEPGPTEDTSCPFCHGDMTSKICNSEEASKLQTPPTVEGTSPAGYVNFSSGIFLRECKRCMAVPDITESVQDTSATEHELETIKAEGREIRRHSDLLSELPDEEDQDSQQPSESEKAKKTEDANKEVVLGYNKTNFEEYLPKPAQRYDDPPLYLCLRVGRPMSKTFPGSSSEGKEASAKCNHKLPEYWFAIPRDKADNLYAFFLQWSPDVYGKEGSQDDVGFVAVDEELESSLEVIEDFFEEPIGKDWEIITKEEANRRRMTILECEMNLPLPELEGATSILLEREHVRKLTKQLPARTEGYSWKNIYSTAEHGYSLRNLYRSMSGVDSPVLLVIRDSSGMIFGALSPCAVKISEHYYGTGETFLFNFIDWELHVYRWTGENNFFIKGNYNSLTLGGGDGAFGLWLDGDLYRGRSRSCKTFSNPCLAHDEDFIIADLEVWGFGLV